ncbi:MAG: phosphatidylserine decarboxylase family protein [Desulfobacterales bacterium]|nr:phosphatidylserine decarboxylase family protein [Desulfobacterales bacterium]
MDKYSWSDPPAQTAFPVAREGYPFIFFSGFVVAVFAILGFKCLSIIGLIVTVFICFFFRDPDRVIPNGEGMFVSPADGRIVYINRVDETPFYDGPCLKISIFMSVFNVHVNRVPYEGEIKKISYFPGKFFNASLDKASKDNEHNAVYLETTKGKRICFVQIAGLIARRIICKVQKDEHVLRGQRFGIICFGSRVDVYLPEGVKIGASVGDKVSAGSSVLGYFV